MPGVAGIVSLKGDIIKDTLQTMLQWLQPLYVEKKEAEEGLFFKNIAIGGKGENIFATNRDQSLKVFFTGRLLRKELLAKELNIAEWTTLSDAELVLQVYQKGGADNFKLLDGSFVFTVLDVLQKELFIARDRTGTYGLFWHANSSYLFFSSSLKSLLATGLISATPDVSAFATYLFLGYIAQDNTPIKDINRLIPGYYLRLTLSGQVSVHSFWSFSSFFTKHHTSSVYEPSQDIYKEIWEYIQDSVQERLKVCSSLPAVCLGSKGANLLNYMLGSLYNIKSRSIDISYIEDPSILLKPGEEEKCKGEKISSTITAQSFLEALVPSIWSLEMPMASPDTVRTWYYMKLCQKFNLSPFTDIGFQEEFSDYSLVQEATPQSRFDRFLRHNAGVQTLQKFIAQIGMEIAPRLSLKLLRQKQERDIRIEFIEKQALLSEAQIRACSSIIRELFHPDLFIHQFYNLSRISSYAASFFYLNIKTRVIDCLVECSARSAISHNVLFEAPFVDHKLLEFLASLKVWSSPDIMSSFATSPIFPEALHIQQASTTSQQVPWKSWLSHPQFKKIFNSLDRGLLVDSGYISRNWLKKYLHGTQETSSTVLCALLVLELWMRLYIDLPMSSINKNLPLEELLPIVD